MDEEKAKEEIQRLIDDFKSNYKQYKTEQEANTETKLIEPLFSILGWTKADFEKRARTRRNNKLGFADYAFKLDGRTVFFLEVKRVGIPLEKEADKQVVSYALSKRIPFAVSTNFEELKIFCVEQQDAINQVFRVFTKPDDFINKFQNLFLLSKESFQKNLTLKEAEEEGRLRKRASIDKTLLDDFMQIRKLIAEDLEKTYPKKYELNEKEEIVQRVIDRLIFIRRCEDIGINPDNLYLEETKHQADEKAYSRLREIFSEYNKIYNSGLFAINLDNDLDSIKINGTIIKKLVEYLYESHDKQYIYNFDWINADVLGQVYEQYLGKILEKTKSGRAKLKEGQAHRKEQGIYYTPIYIVDYIVKNTVLSTLKNTKKKEDLKIVDTACGSGSFLIKAFDYLYEELSKNKEANQNKLDSQGAYSIKTEILKRNIYGVDLDNKAVEITKLNLLLKASEKNRKLPEELDLHIKHGNSLVDDESFKNAFEWNGDFRAGSFDVVIGNPPYIDSEEMVKTQPEIREYLTKKYATAKGNWDIFLVFIEKGLLLLKDGGYLGMIVPNKLLSADYAKAIRGYIQNYKIISIRDYSKIPVFKASVYPIVIIIKKESPKSNRFLVETMKPDTDGVKIELSKTFKQEDLDTKNQSTWAHIFSESGTAIIDKITSDSINLDEIANVFGAATVSEAYELKKTIQELDKQKDYFKFINTGTIDSYRSLWGLYKTKYIKDSYKKPIVNREDLKKFSDKRYAEASKEKIIIAGMTKELECYLDKGEYLAGKSTTVITFKKINLEVLSAILNSKLMSYVYKNLFKSLSLAGGYIRVGAPQIKILPIKVPSELQQKTLIQLVSKISNLNKQLNELGIKTTSETKELSDKITDLDKEINKEIYNIYKMNDKEIKIIETNI